MTWNKQPKAPKAEEPTKETLSGIEFVVSQYGGYRAKLPLAEIEMFWEAGGYQIRINGDLVKWREGVAKPTTPKDAGERLVLVLKGRISKLTALLGDPWRPTPAVE